MRSFFDEMLTDIYAGRESWRVLTFFSGVASAVTAFYVWW